LKNYTPVAQTLEPNTRKYGEMIFVKHGISILNTKCIDMPSKMGRTLLYTQIQKNDTIYNIITFHLESMNSSAYRHKQLKIMWEFVGNFDNVICCGDTNQTDKELQIVSKNFLDAWEQTDRKIGKYTYYSSRYWDGNGMQRYDKVWYSTDLSLQGFGVLGNVPLRGPFDELWISDHDGLLCMFK
jgi:hypothetical protein